jgi:hypothetical protein
MRINFLAVMVALASGLGAQAQGTPLTFGGSISKTALARAVQDCDRKVLRPPCSEIILRFREIHQKSFSDSSSVAQAQLADYIRSLNERPCPAGGRFRATEWVPGSGGTPGQLIIGYGYWSCRSSERLLWEGEKPILSLADGHIIVEYQGPSAQVASGARSTQPSGVTRTTRTTTSEQRLPRGVKEEIQPPAVVRGPPGESGSPGTDCAGLPPTDPPRTCPGQPGKEGPPGTVVVVTQKGPGWCSRNCWWVALASTAVAGAICESRSRRFGNEPWSFNCVSNRNENNIDNTISMSLTSVNIRF